MAAYIPIAFELLAQNAVLNDRIFVKYQRRSTGEMKPGGVYVLTDSARRFFRLISPWRKDPYHPRRRLKYSVQITEDICFLVKEEDALLLKSRCEPFDDAGRMLPFRRHCGPKAPTPLSPFTRAGYDWDLSELEVLPAPCMGVTSSPIAQATIQIEGTSRVVC